MGEGWSLCVKLLTDTDKNQPSWCTRWSVVVTTTSLSGWDEMFTWFCATEQHFQKGDELLGPHSDKQDVEETCRVHWTLVLLFPPVLFPHRWNWIRFSRSLLLPLSFTAVWSPPDSQTFVSPFLLLLFWVASRTSRYLKWSEKEMTHNRRCSWATLLPPFTLWMLPRQFFFSTRE